MKIPKSIKIGNMSYTVIESDFDDSKQMGSSDTVTQIIKLKPSLSREKKEETLIHEIVHTILDLSEFDVESENEKLVTCIANGIYQVFKENGLLKDE